MQYGKDTSNSKGWAKIRLLSVSSFHTEKECGGSILKSLIEKNGTVAG